MLSPDIKASIGLSPRLRGNLYQTPLTRILPGSIPAPAGEPASKSSVCIRNWVYPRACGGTTFPSPSLPPPCGLSPRLRGNQLFIRNDGHTAGSIPAPAGEPVTSPPYWGLREVYPRACGGTGRMELTACANP